VAEIRLFLVDEGRSNLLSKNYFSGRLVSQLKTKGYLVTKADGASSGPASLHTFAHL
jgi:hypothetical protein